MEQEATPYVPGSSKHSAWRCVSRHSPHPYTSAEGGLSQTEILPPLRIRPLGRRCGSTPCEGVPTPWRLQTKPRRICSLLPQQDHIGQQALNLQSSAIVTLAIPWAPTPSSVDIDDKLLASRRQLPVIGVAQRSTHQSATAPTRAPAISTHALRVPVTGPSPCSHNPTVFPRSDPRP